MVLQENRFATASSATWSETAVAFCGEASGKNDSMICPFFVWVSIILRLLFFIKRQLEFMDDSRFWSFRLSFSTDFVWMFLWLSHLAFASIVGCHLPMMHCCRGTARGHVTTKDLRIAYPVIWRVHARHDFALQVSTCRPRRAGGCTPLSNGKSSM